MITEKDVTATGLLLYTTEASQLRMAPGYLPGKLDTTLGNGQPFLQVHMEARDGDLLWVDYKQLFGCIDLRVFND